MLALAVLSACAAAAGADGPAGPVRLVSASFLGGSLDDELIGAGVGADGSIVLAGNSVDLQMAGLKPLFLGPQGELRQAEPPSDPKKAKDWIHPSTFGFIARLSPDGSSVRGLTRFGYGVAVLKKMRLDEKGRIYVLGEAKETVSFGAVSGSGTFIAALSPDAGKILAATFAPGALDFGVDSSGELLVLTKGKLTRYGPDWRSVKWTAGWRPYGDDRPGGVAVSPQTGIAAVIGYGMTHTGKEPWKDPYAFGFDRSGKQIWALWNPEPGRQKGTQFGGNGLMADTTGRCASVGAGGELLLILYADGGNSVCTRDPSDPDKPLDPSVFQGAFQKHPGHGFKGASCTSVIFRADPLTGKLQKGTWMCAWISPARANSLSMEMAASDERGVTFVVGNSAFGCPTKAPWFEPREGAYKGGGFLAVFDRDFGLIQCGYFSECRLVSVGCRNGYVVVAGEAKAPPQEPEAARGVDSSRLLRPLQRDFGGGRKDGYFAIFQIN